MPHDPPRFSLLNLEDPVDRQIAKIDLTLVDLLRRSNGPGSRTNLERLRSAGALGIDVLSRTTLELFVGLGLPDFLDPLELIPDPPPIDPSTEAINRELDLRQSFTNLIGESLPVLSEGTGREDLTRGSI